MKLSVISFTRSGGRCCQKLVKGFSDRGEHCCGYVQEKYRNAEEDIPGLGTVYRSLGDWTSERFSDSEGIIFVGAAGIAVRAIAPYVKDKRTDPAVVVIDEEGKWAISLLSGHVGGANALARAAAELIGAAPVITTATDNRQKTAVDVLAQEAGLVISDWNLAKLVSAEILEEHPVGFFSDFSWPDKIPEGFTQKQSCSLHVWVTARNEPEEHDLLRLFLLPDSRILRLVPKIYYIGVGCRKGALEEVVREAVLTVMRANNLSIQGIAAIASIHIKKEEPSLFQTAEKWKAGFITFSEEELNAVEGEFTSSAFVKQVTGTDNVCERAALAAAGKEGCLLVRKQIINGVTIAVAQIPWNKEGSSQTYGKVRNLYG